MPGNAVHNRRKTKVTILVLALLVLAGVPLLRISMTAPVDPVSTGGKRLSGYLFDLNRIQFPWQSPGIRTSNSTSSRARQRDEQRRLAEVAIKTFGPQAIPLLSNWWEDGPGIRRRLRSLANTPGFRWLGHSRWISSD